MFLMFAYGAYCPQDALAAWDCTWCGQYGAAGFMPTAFFNAADNFGFAGYHNDTDTIVIAFRGTVMTNLQNWITDLSSIGLMPYPGCSTCQVGVGFYTAYQALMSQVRSAYTELSRLRPSAAVVFTGHSLGAALATIAAADLSEQNPGLRPSLQLYGSPRIGNIDMAEHVQGVVARADAMRMVWIDDIVPHLPPVSAGFNHINTEVWMPSVGGSFEVCNSPPYGEDPDCSDSVPLSKWSVEDHLSYYGLSEGC